jgi:predicted NAD-dependent protein-ADP-ribosyltransferase YbiA (DUF1768 family)
MIDIFAKAAGPAGALSNFAAHDFIFRGVPCASMEGLLQALKFADCETQKSVCLMTGKAAKAKGLETDWRPTQTLYWQGEAIDRHGTEYQALLDEAFHALFTHNAAARHALLATGKEPLRHSMGVKDPRETILTEDEFCSRLVNLRAKIILSATTGKGPLHG